MQSPATDPSLSPLQVALRRVDKLNSILEVAKAMTVQRDLDLRPTVTAIYRELRTAGPCAGRQLEALLRGPATPPRPPVLAGRAMRVLVELGLAACDRAAAGGFAARVVEADRTSLDRSPTYRALAGRLAEAERHLAAAGAARAA